MYVTRTTVDSGATWQVASSHTLQGDASTQMGIMIAANGIDPTTVKVSQHNDDGSFTDV